MFLGPDPQVLQTVVPKSNKQWQFATAETLGACWCVRALYVAWIFTVGLDCMQGIWWQCAKWRKKILFPWSAIKILLFYFESSGLQLSGLQLFKDVINISDILLNAVCFDYQTQLEYCTLGDNDNIDLPMYRVQYISIIRHDFILVETLQYKSNLIVLYELWRWMLEIGCSLCCNGFV